MFPLTALKAKRMTMLKEEGYRLMGAAFEVYNQLGYGMAEEVYQQSLEIELELRGIPFQSKEPLTAFYKGGACSRLAKFRISSSSARSSSY